MEHDLDLVADLNAQDDDGLGWSTLSLGPSGSTPRVRGRMPDFSDQGPQD